MCWWPQSPEGRASCSPTDDGTTATMTTTTIDAARPHSPVRTRRRGAFEAKSGDESTPTSPRRRPASSGRPLELTPVWEQAVRYNRLPQSVDGACVFAELALRLASDEWEVRRHALRVLVDLLAAVPDPDALMLPVVLAEVTLNLDHAAPAVRAGALDALAAYVRRSADPEFVVRSVVAQGLESPAASDALALDVLAVVPPLVRALRDTLDASGRSVSRQGLVQLVTALGRHLDRPDARPRALAAAAAIGELVGEARLERVLEIYYPRLKSGPDSNYGDSGVDNGKAVDENFNSNEDDWSDVGTGTAVHRSADVATSSASTVERSRFELADEELRKLESNGKLFSRIDTDSVQDVGSRDEDDYAPSESDEAGGRGRQHSSESEAGRETVDVDSVFGEVTGCHDDEADGVAGGGGRVVMETEITFDSATAITMTILEEKEEPKSPKKTEGEPLVGGDGDGGYTNDFVMRVVDDEEAKRTPRKVRFGGEVVKLRTPDSDVTVEIHEETKAEESPPKRREAGLSVTGKESVLYARSRSSQSQIPVPVTPPPRRRRRSLGQPTAEEGGSGGRAVGPDDWQAVGFIDRPQLDNLLRKDDWRARVRALDKLTVSLRQPEVARSVSASSAGLGLLVFLLKTLTDDRSQRVICSSLRATSALVQALSVSAVLAELPSLVWAVARRLGGGGGGGGGSVAVKLEAVQAAKVLLKAVRPPSIVQALLGDKLLRSDSSRMRENALLWLMYALMTYPSGEFALGEMARRVVIAGEGEPRRRVRQAVLECLAALAQHLPLTRLRPADDGPFARAVRTRLARRTLPSVSLDGLVLYGLHVAPDLACRHDSNSSSKNTGSESSNGGRSAFTVETGLGDQGSDVEWVLAGTGPLSSGSARSRSQLQNAQRAFVSPPISTTTAHRQHSPHRVRRERERERERQGGANDSGESITSEESKGSRHLTGGSIRKPYSSLALNGYVYPYETSYHQDRGLPKLYSRLPQPSGPGFRGWGAHDPDPAHHPHVSVNLPPLHWRQLQHGDGPQRERSSRWSHHHHVDEQRRPRSRFTSPSSPAHGRFVSSSSPPAAAAAAVQPQPASLTPTPSPSDQHDDRLSPRPDTGSRAGNDGNAVSLPAAAPNVVQDERVNPSPSPSPSPSPQPPPPATAADCVETVTPPPPPPQPQLTNTRRRGGGRSPVDPVDPVGGSDVAPLDDPKDALTRCLIQMGDPEWEVTVRGLQTLVQLFCHHPSTPSHRPQHVIAAVTRLVRSLRSQVARVASKAATHLFSSMGRNIENIRETEELCSVLLNRTADTNKFLRGDCNAALDAMVDRFTAPRAVTIVVAKGARHQNAVVRATCCRLLMRVCARLGAERTLSMPRDARDAVLNAAARGLTEGSLDNRRYAKELLVLLSGDVRLEAMLKEAVPATVMRSIAKALTRLVAAR